MFPHGGGEILPLSQYLFYSSENINYLQRKACHNYNIIAGMLSSGSYGNLVPEKMKFYAYDVNKHSFPKGIGDLKSPPTDKDGSKMFTEEQRNANLPALYVFPATNKAMPW